VYKEGQSTGEELLASKFALNHHEALQQTNLTKSIMQETKNKPSRTPDHKNADNPFRPTTPMLSHSQIKSPSSLSISNNTQVQLGPFELKSRPKIVRTPMANDRSNSSIEE